MSATTDKLSQDQKVEPADSASSISSSGEDKSQSRPEFSLDILKLTKAAQIQHGLRHGEYSRYRQYCALRLSRLRKKLGFTHGKGRFVQKKLTVQHVTQQKYLLLPLMSAERSWSLAMELKENQENNPRARFHMLRRLKKAVKASNGLVALCAEMADDKTKLEAEAYCCWMTGNLRLEQEDWAPALESFTRAKTIYDHLSKVGDAETQETFKQRVQEIEPTIRFCNYNLSQGEDLTGLKGSVVQSTGSDVLLQTKLEKVLTDLRKKESESMREITWNGKAVPVKNEKLRELVLAAQDSIFQIEKIGSLASKLELYDKTFITYNDALNIIRDELRQLQAQSAKKNVKAEGQESDLRFLFGFLSYTKLSKTVDRNLLLINSLTNKSDDPKQRSASPKEIIKLYDTIIQNVTEMSGLRDTDDEKYHKTIAAKLLTFKAFRCFYVAQSYYNASKWPETYALLDRTVEHIKSAIDHHEKCSPPSTEDIESLKRLQDKVKGKRAAARAKAFAESQAQKAQPTEEKESTEGSATAVLDQDKFDLNPRRLKENIIAFPPDFEAIPCKPILFDLALTSLEFPDLTERKKTKAKGGFFGFWRS